MRKYFVRSGFGLFKDHFTTLEQNYGEISKVVFEKSRKVLENVFSANEK